MIRRYFNDFTDSALLYQRIVGDIQHFADIYLQLRAGYDDEYLIYNKLLDQNQQYLLILSCLTKETEDTNDIINGIARKFDQFHTIIRLLDVYESNTFQRMIYPINREIREKSLNNINSVFDRAIIAKLEEAEVLRKGEVLSVPDLFTFERFKGARNRWTNFSKYILMRIDRYLSQLLDKPSYAGGDLEELEEHFNKTTRRKYGMHLEHIYAYNEPNMALFTSEDHGFDEQQFSLARNLLGMVLLLKDKQNISSNNEIFRDKINTYGKSNFIWNELLAGHLHGVDERNIPKTLLTEAIQPDKSGAFPKEKIGLRQRLLFNAIKLIWCDLVPSSLV
jgi:hypothetical protein